ncbi:MAG: hypothetical protein AABY00_04270 [Nanoarchaeota archaeon]
MKKRTSWIRFVLLFILVVIAFIGGFFIRETFTGRAVTETLVEDPQLYSWTFALCTEKGRCMDVHAECNGTHVLKILSVTEIGGHDDGWEDPRGGNPSVCPWNSLKNDKS